MGISQIGIMEVLVILGICVGCSLPFVLLGVVGVVVALTQRKPQQPRGPGW